jgi:Tfp pilus assembly protein PilV
MKYNQKGQSMFEVVFTLAIIALITSAMVLLATFSIKNATYSRNKTLATRYSQDTVEWLREQRDADWLIFYSHIPSNYPQKNCLISIETDTWPIWTTCGENDNISGTVFKRELEFPNKSANSVTIKIIVSWMDSQGYHEVSSYTDFTDWKGK